MDPRGPDSCPGQNHRHPRTRLVHGTRGPFHASWARWIRGQCMFVFRKLGENLELIMDLEMGLSVCRLVLIGRVHRLSWGINGRVNQTTSLENGIEYSSPIFPSKLWKDRDKLGGLTKDQEAKSSAVACHVSTLTILTLTQFETNFSTRPLSHFGSL